VVQGRGECFSPHPAPQGDKVIDLRPEKIGQRFQVLSAFRENEWESSVGDNREDVCTDELVAPLAGDEFVAEPLELETLIWIG